MKIIFLDIDGVLNSEQYCDYLINVVGQEHGYGGFFNTTEEATMENVKWDPLTVNRLVRIVEETDAKIVMSSTWRHSFSIAKFNEMFALYDVFDKIKFDIISKTPELHAYGALEPYGMSGYGSQQGFRGDEVKIWLEANPDLDIESYVILDDGTDFHIEQQPFFVNTDEDIGLTDEDAANAIRILNTFSTI